MENFSNDKQPYPNILKENLPANFFLFSVAYEGKSNDTETNFIANSTVHFTEEYIVTRFYKSISNIV